MGAFSPIVVINLLNRSVVVMGTEHSSISEPSLNAEENTSEQKQEQNSSGGQEVLSHEVPFKDGGDEAGENVEEEEEEEDLVDPMDTLRDSCKAQKNCHALSEKLDACTARVESREKNTEECIEEMLDLIHCVDGCVSKMIHTKWK